MSLTPADYAALRMRLDRFTGYREVAMHWPHVSIDAGPVALDGISVTEGGRCDPDAIAARAAWWTALVAPRREAEADAHDGRLEAYGRILGWRLSDPNPTGPVETWALFWRHADEPGVELTTEQLRARLAFDNPPCDFCGGHQPSPHVFPCSKCGGLGKLIPGWNPTTHVEPVPQRDASHGARCGCVDRGPWFGGPGWVSGSAPHAAKLGCQFCTGTGTVHDGRRDDAGAREYAPGDPTALFSVREGITMRTDPQRELAHRREQPDAFGHPYEMALAARERRISFANEMVDAVEADPLREDGLFMGSQEAWDTLDSWAFECDESLARAPLAETLHGERDDWGREWPAAFAGDDVQIDVRVSSTSRRERP